MARPLRNLLEREFNLAYYMHFSVMDQRRTDSFILDWHYSRLNEQLRREKDGSSNGH